MPSLSGGGCKTPWENRYMHTDGGSGSGMFLRPSSMSSLPSSFLPTVFCVASSHSAHSRGRGDPSVCSSVSCPVILKRSSAASHGTVNGGEFVTEKV